jgi:uncharacterized protein YbjT (DUF2867 family)
MILVAGGTGKLGTLVVQLLLEGGLPVTVMTRDAAKPAVAGTSNVVGDVRSADDCRRVVAGMTTVISAVQGFSGTGDTNPQTVDLDGNRNLIAAAKAARVEHFILISVQGAAPDHPLELFRMKYGAEEALRASGMSWTIIRPTAFMEIWAALVGEPLVRTGKTRIFGRGENPINFVAAQDVARYVVAAVSDPAMRDQMVEVGGPQNLTLKQIVEVFEAETGKTGSKSHVPRALMRVMSVLMRPINPTMTRQIQAGYVMDTIDMSFDASATSRRFPDIRPTTLNEVVRREYVVRH